MYSQDNTPGYLVAMAFLIGILLPLNWTSSSLKREYDSNPENIVLQPYELFARKDISGASSIYEFVNNTTEKAQGICNFDKGKLATNEVFIFNEVRIGYTPTAAAGKAGEVAYETTPSAALRNAEFEITQGSRTVLSLPAASLINTHTGENIQDDFLTLGSLCYLRDDQDFKFSFKFPSGQTIAASSTGSTFSYGEVRLRGYRTIKNG